MRELLAAAEEVDEQDPAELLGQALLTTYVTLALFAIGVGVDCLGNGFPHYGHFFTMFGLSALVFLAGEYTVRQHRSLRPLPTGGFTGRERALFVGSLTALTLATAF